MWQRWVVYDGSGSMWGQIDGVAKVEIVRDVMSDLIATWPEGANVGLMAYGHCRELKCACVGGSSNVPLGFVSLTENLIALRRAANP